MSDSLSSLPPVIPAQAGIHPPVIPAQAGIQDVSAGHHLLGSRLRGNDGGVQ